MMPLQLDFKPSMTLTLIMSAVGIGTCVILILLPWIVQIKLLAIAMVLGAAVYHILCNALLMLPWSFVSVSINNKQEVTLIQKSGTVQQVTIDQDTVVMPSFTLINCQCIERNPIKKRLQMHVLIVPDMVCPEAFRQLRVFLRWGSAATG